jgi:hypothetical protein
MRARLAYALLVCVFSVIGCGPTAKKKPGTDAPGGGDGKQPHTFEGIQVMPTNPIVQLDLNQPGSQQFSAVAVYADGVNEDVTASTTWNVANPAVGAMSAATLAIPAFSSSNAVVSLITADYNGSQGMAQITVVAYRQSGTQQDFFFILPYVDPAGQMMKPLDFATAIPALDVFFSMDTTGSMGGEIANLQSALNGTVIPGIQAAVANTQFGVGAQEDFPVDGYGSTNCPSNGINDQPLKVLQTITNNSAAITAAVNGLSVSPGGAPIGCGADGPEAGLEAIYLAATGNGLAGPAPTSVPVNHSGVGGVAFRQGTMPVIVGISDADSHGVGETGTCGTAEAYDANVSAYAHSRAQTKTALGAICARFVGIAPQSATPALNCIAEPYQQDLATTTGARVPPEAWDFTGTRPAGCAAGQCCTGFSGAGRAPDAQGLCPLVFRANLDGTGVSTSIVTGIQMLTRFATFDVTSQTTGVTTDINGNPLPGGYTTANFIKAVTPATYTLPPPPPVLPNPTYDTTTFHNVTPGTQVGFNVDAFNDFVMQTDQPQIFRANIQVLAGGCTPLDQRDVLILVPPIPILVQ